MSWEKVTYEREKLFVDVWTTPITKLAKDYRLSDVGLRKICLALDIPLPPRGYWARLAAGKTYPKPILQKTNRPTTYERTINIVRVDKTLEERVAQAQGSMADATTADAPDYVPPSNPATFSKQAKLVVNAMKGAKPVEGALTSLGVTWADVSVSEELKERTFLLVDRFAYELEILGAKFEDSHPPLPTLRNGMRRRSDSKRNCFILHGQTFFVRIQERITQELVPAPPRPEKPSRGRARQTAWEYRSPVYRYLSTGKLKVSIVDARTYYENCKVEDTARGTIEEKVRKAVQSSADAALRMSVENELRAERETDRRKKAQEWEVAKKNKDALLAQLSAFEKMANDLHRARLLRLFIDEISARKPLSSELVGNLELMALMANWLDPLVKADWPDVDDVAEKNPYGGLW